VIIQPSGSLPGSFRMIFAHHNVSQSQSVRLEYRHDPTEDDQRRDLRVPIQIRRYRIRQARHQIDLYILRVRCEGFHDAPVKVGEIAVARHIDAYGIGSLDLEIDIYTFRQYYLFHRDYSTRYIFGHRPPIFPHEYSRTTRITQSRSKLTEHPLQYLSLSDTSQL